jgi:hypothetical protein
MASFFRGLFGSKDKAQKEDEKGQKREEDDTPSSAAQAEEEEEVPRETKEEEEDRKPKEPGRGWTAETATAAIDAAGNTADGLHVSLEVHNKGPQRKKHSDSVHKAAPAPNFELRARFTNTREGPAAGSEEYATLQTAMDAVGSPFGWGIAAPPPSAADFPPGNLFICLRHWWVDRLLVVDTERNAVVQPLMGPRLPCGGGEQVKLLWPGAECSEEKPFSCTQPAMQDTLVGWDLNGACEPGREYRIYLVHESPPSHGYGEGDIGFSGVVVSEPVTVTWPSHRTPRADGAPQLLPLSGPAVKSAAKK